MAKIKIAVVAATSMELESLRKHCEAVPYTNLELSWIVAGVGMVNTAMHLTNSFGSHCPNLAINIGIAGSFTNEMPIGNVVQVHTDRIAYFGAEDSTQFISAETIGLCPAEEVIFEATASLEAMPNAKGITVMMAHGSAASIQKALDLWNPDVESMEGAAFFRVCRHFNIPAMQIRAISNLVEPRNRAKWNIPLAVNNLTERMLSVLHNLNNGN